MDRIIRENKTEIRKSWLLIGILILATIIRLYNIGFQSPWMDEIYSLNEANPSNSLSEVYRLVVNGEANPPLYFYVLHFIFKVFGYTIETARLFSAALGVLGVYAAYLLGKTFYNRNTGLIAAFLLSINYFHIFYSQEARPYSFFCTFSIFSLYFMVKFIKDPSWRNTIYFSIFSALMIYGHFFGLLGLFAQYLILLYVIMAGPANNRKNLYVKSFAAGILTLILYIPSLGILFAAASIKKFWIPFPEPTVYTDIYKGFFGNSELLLAICNLLLLLYFINLTRQRRNLSTQTYPWNNMSVFFFIIFGVWILVMLAIPLVRSHVSAPMILDRYYINVLPLVLILIAAGLSLFRNRTVACMVLLLFSVFSFADIVVVKRYYHSLSKTQFREASEYIIKNNQSDSPIVSSRGWYLSFFLKNDKVNYNVINRPIEEYLAGIKQDTTKITAFWYIDGHSKPYNILPEDQAFLDKHYLLEGSFDGLDMYTRFFIPIKDANKFIDIKKYGELKKENGDKIHYNIEVFNNVNDSLSLSGWSFFDGVDAQTSTTKLLLIKDKEVINMGALRIQRPDVSEYFKKGYNLTNVGYDVKTSTKDLEKGTYKIGIYMIDRMNGKEGLVISDKVITK